jgi:hypothetical protein
MQLDMNVAPFSVPYRPDGHSRQSLAAALPVVSAYVPARQSMQSLVSMLPVKVLYVPLLHGEQMFEPAAYVWCPAAHVPDRKSVV